MTENLPQKPWNSPCLPILFWSPPRFCRATWQNSTSSQFIWFRPLESTDSRRPSVRRSSRNGHHALVCQCHNAMFWSDPVSNVSSNVIFWLMPKARFPGKSQLALSWSWFCVWWWEWRRWQPRDVFQSFSCKTRFWPTSSSSRLSFHFLLQSLLHHHPLLLPEETLLWIIFFHSWQLPSQPSLLQIDVVLYWQLTQRSATSKSNLLLDDFKAAGFAPWRSYFEGRLWLKICHLSHISLTRLKKSLALVSLSHIA